MTSCGRSFAISFGVGLLLTGRVWATGGLAVRSFAFLLLAIVEVGGTIGLLDGICTSNVGKNACLFGVFGGEVRVMRFAIDDSRFGLGCIGSACCSTPGEWLDDISGNLAVRDPAEGW